MTGIDFSDPVWLRLGFINEAQYNWFGESDIQRGKRESRWGTLLHPWRLTMPYFVMYRFPAEFVGSRLCWQGYALWEAADGRFVALRHAAKACRPIERDDIGRSIFGLSIAAPLAMELEAPRAIQLRRLMEPGLALVEVVAVLLLLVRWRSRELALPLSLIGLALLVVLLHDASFIGGVRPFDGGDDGLFYEGVGRRIMQYALAGDFWHALEGGEHVYYYGGPGLRYFRAVEHFIFGDSFLGYLSLILAMPLVVFAIFRRFLTARARAGADTGVRRCSGRRGVRLDLLPVRQMGCARFRRSRGGGVFSRRLAVAGRSRASRSGPPVCACRGRRIAVRAGALGAAQSGARRGRAAWRRRARRRCGSANSFASPGFASGSCRCSAWLCTIGTSAVSSCCSAPTRPWPKRCRCRLRITLRRSANCCAPTLPASMSAVSCCNGRAGSPGLRNRSR